jgi:hypothetical protein
MAGSLNSRAVVATLAATMLAILLAVPVFAADADGDGLEDEWERTYGLTDPALADTDGDGLIDSAEDPDDDRLGNLGEQRFGTDPGDPDSNDDGIGDGEEDALGNGADNARDQDRRPAPANLRPEPASAWWDRPPNYDDECHGDQYDPELHPCAYGVEGSEITVVLFGDSHALQWQPGLKVAALANEWQLVILTKAACPPSQVVSSRKDPAAQESCDAWRPLALEWIAQNEPDVVIMTGGGRIYRLEDDGGERLSADERTAAWTRGLARTIEAIEGSTVPVVLADTPYLQTNPATCLANDPSDMLACLTPRANAIDAGLDAAEREAVEAAGATYVDLGGVLCPYSPCPVVFGDVLGWRNRDHITATFSETLAPSLTRIVEEALAAGSSLAPEASSLAPEASSDAQRRP